jgi:hypothetical protein
MGEIEAQKIVAHDLIGTSITLIGNPSHAPCVQRSLRVLLQSEYRLLGQALGLGDDR